MDSLCTVQFSQSKSQVAPDNNYCKYWCELRLTVIPPTGHLNPCYADAHTVDNIKVIIVMQIIHGQVGPGTGSPVRGVGSPIPGPTCVIIMERLFHSDHILPTHIYLCYCPGLHSVNTYEGRYHQSPIYHFTVPLPEFTYPNSMGYTVRSASYCSRGPMLFYLTLIILFCLA